MTPMTITSDVDGLGVTVTTDTDDTDDTADSGHKVLDGVTANVTKNG